MKGKCPECREHFVPRQENLFPESARYYCACAMQLKVCPHCGRIRGWGIRPEGFQGEWCCGARDVTYVPVTRLDLVPPAEAEFRKLRRRVEDRLRKDPETVAEMASKLGLI